MLTVFGSIIVDSIFRVPTLPREGETVLADDLFIGPGGKGANQAVAAAKSGGDVAMVGSVGSDPAAEISLESFRAAGVETSGILKQEGPTGSAAVQVNTRGTNQISVAPAANRLTRADMLDQNLWEKTTTLLLQMEIPQEEIEAAIFEAASRGIRTILNLAPAGPLSRSALEALDILIVNEVELEMLADLLGLAAKPHAELSRDLQDTLGIGLVVTLGAEGAFYLDGSEPLHAPALDVIPVDTTGAGDAFCGTFAASLDRGHTIADALRRGVIAGSLACLKTGAQEATPSAADIEARL